MASDSRERMLGRIREALRNKAEPRHLHGRVQAGFETHDASDWLPQVPDGIPERIALFEKNSADLKTEFHRCADQTALQAGLLNLAGECSWKSVATHDFQPGNPAVAALQLKTLRTDHAYDKNDLERCDVGISGCECLIAQTGGILVSAKSSGGRALSVLPPHHVVIATRSQVTGDLADAIACVRASHGGVAPAFFSFITGPSRTGDIERILVLGAHGPKRLTVFLLES